MDLRRWWRNFRGSSQNQSILHLPSFPVSRSFGFDRGLPVDRYYIERFLEEHRDLIRGTVVEIAESTYTRRFGSGLLEKACVLHVDPASRADLIGNLETGENIPSEYADGLILTQTLPFLFDVRSAIRHAHRMLKQNGALLLTVPGITQISRYDMDRWGHFWSFTDLSIRRLLGESFKQDQIRVQAYGNVKASTAFLYGLSAGELPESDLIPADPDYQLLIAAVAIK